MLPQSGAELWQRNLYIKGFWELFYIGATSIKSQTWSYYIIFYQKKNMERDKLRFTNAQTKKQKITKITSTFPILDQVLD